MTIDKEILRPADLSSVLGLTTGRIYQLIADGAIPSVRVGGAIRIPRAAWEKWLRERTDEALASLTSSSSRIPQRDPAPSEVGP